MTASISVTSFVGVRAVAGRRVKSGGRKRPAYEKTSGEFARKDGGGFVTKTQTIDRENRTYSERVVDLATGEVLRDVEHRLPEHTGRGSDKPRE